MNLTGCSDLSQVESLQLHVNTHIDALPTLGMSNVTVHIRSHR